jgi:hypothetical protein
MGGSIFSSPISGQDKIIRGLEREDLFAVVSEQFLTDTAPLMATWTSGLDQAGTVLLPSVEQKASFGVKLLPNSGASAMAM